MASVAAQRLRRLYYLLHVGFIYHVGLVYMRRRMDLYSPGRFFIYLEEIA